MEGRIVQNNRNDEISLKDVVLKFRQWFKYILSKWLIVVVCGILGGFGGLMYAWYLRPVFKATTIFVLEDTDNGGSGLGQYAGLASMVGIDVGGGGNGIFQGDNILELYKSRSMIQKTLLTKVQYNGKPILLIDRYIEFNGLREKWVKKTQLVNINFEAPANGNLKSYFFNRVQDSIIGVIVDDINKKYLDVSKPDKKLSIIKAEVNAEDEFFAKNFNEQIVKNVSDFYIQTKTKKSLDNVAILQMKTDSVKAVLNGAIYSAAAVADATPNLNVTRQMQRSVPIQQSQVTSETNKAILGELVKNLELSKISLRKETPLIQVIDGPIYPLLKIKLSYISAIILGCVGFGLLTILFLTARRLVGNVKD